MSVYKSITMCLLIICCCSVRKMEQGAIMFYMLVHLVLTVLTLHKMLINLLVLKCISTRRSVRYAL